MLLYAYDEAAVDIRETANEADVEFRIRLLTAPPEAMEAIRETFDDNRVHTDVLVYPYPDRDYRVIVRKDYYERFVLELMRMKLLRRVEWRD
ncbi:MAG TPA: hypothetical protein VEZ72_19790 [Paenibacillus sp.]|nr:hypothetical protein [Paenibacillus sp.]